MRKGIIHIIMLGLAAFLLCTTLFNISCNREPDCSNCIITPQQEAIVSFYKSGDSSVFKNDMTGIYDTLRVKEYYKSSSGCSYPCDYGTSRISAIFKFSHLNDCFVYINHTSIPHIDVSGINLSFNLNGAVQSITINNTNYNDVYVPSINSAMIADSLQNRIPWKIAYSKSKGFIRFYMVNGQTWSKQ